MENKRPLPIENVSFANSFYADENKEKFLKYPNNPATNLAQQALGISTEGVEGFIRRKELINKNAKLSVSSENGSLHISSRTEKNSIELTVPDLSHQNVATQNLFPYFLMETCKRCISNGELYSETFIFKTSDLVNIGMYSTIQSAKKALITARQALKTISIGQTETKGKTTQGFTETTLFPTIALSKKGECYVRVNPDVVWNMITEYWTIMPSYFFHLSRRGKDLISLIFTIARQNIRKENINKNENGELFYSFFIKYRTIQTALHLPSENKRDKNGKISLIKKAYEYIKQPIEQAAAEIEEAHRNTYKNTDFQLLMCVDENLRINKWLDTGFLQITLQGDFLNPFLDILSNRVKKIEEYTKKKEKREEEAKIRCLAESIKNEPSKE